ncbi:MAG: ParB N-terminal domain-containing protein [Deltaproteobacteria bacterium]|nr:ParB N-terminal domain-containing protein [Deltaproteobacteria bacterium]
MKINLQVSRIPLKQIDFDDSFYELRPQGDDELPADFIESIKKCGILHPPILREQGNGAYIIMAGRRRLRAARDILSLNSCNCLIVHSETSTLACLELVLEEGRLSPTWSPVMKAKYLAKIIAVIGREEAVVNVLPRLGITPQMYHLEKLLGLADLEEPLALAIHQGRVAEKTAYELSRLPFRDRFILFDLINSLKLSVGNQRQIFAICNDLAKRASSSIHAVLSEPAITSILKETGQNIPQQTAKLMKILHVRRFPHFTAANREFICWQNGLNLPAWAHISHSPVFEVDQVSLHLSFANRGKLADFCQQFIG